MLDLIIVGASGFGLELLQYLIDANRDSGEIRFKGFIDDDPGKHGRNGFPNGFHADVLGDTESYSIQTNDRFLVAIGNPVLRRGVVDRLCARDAKFITLIHPLAYVADTASLGDGCIVAPFASVGTNAVVGDHCLVNLYSTVGHDCHIGSCTVLSPYSVANGESKVGSAVFMGTHCVVTPLAIVGDECKVAAGSVVYRESPARCLISGNPATAVALKRSKTADVNSRESETSDA